MLLFRRVQLLQAQDDTPNLQINDSITQIYYSRSAAVTALFEAS